MRLLIGLLFSFVVAGVIGLGSTWFALSGNLSLGALSLGAWKADPRRGTAGIDPYSRAAIARNGELPIGVGDGITFTARADDAGRPLDGRCDVVVRGTTPPARYFTLTLYTPSGSLVANSLSRFGFTSQELVRDRGGDFEVVVSPRARPGNWLPTGGVERYLLVMRFYDTSLGIATRAGREAPMPTLTSFGEMHMIRWLLWIVGGLVLGGVVHLVSIMWLPRTATQDAYARLAPLGPVNGFKLLPAPTPADSTMPFMDPAFVAAVCRYDLTKGPVKLSVPLSQSYTSVTFYTRYDIAYYAINDRSAGRRAIELDLMTTKQRDDMPDDEDVTAADRLIVESPTVTGLIIARAFSPEPSLLPTATAALTAAQCKPQ